MFANPYATMVNQDDNVPILDDSNWTLFEDRFVACSQYKGWSKWLREEPAADAPAADVIQAEQLFGLLRLKVSDQFRSDVKGAGTAKKAWAALQSRAQRSSEARRMILRDDLFRLSLREKESALAYIARARDLSAQLKAAGQDTDENSLIRCIIDGLPTSWELWSKINRGRFAGFEDLTRSMLDEEASIRRAAEKQSEIATAMAAAASSRGNGRGGGGGGRGGGRGQGRGGRGRGQHGGCNISLEERRKQPTWGKGPKNSCFSCHGMNHRATQCTNQPAPEPAAAAAAEVHYCMAATTAVTPGYWTLDSGCTRHMTGDPMVLSSREPTATTSVVFANGEASTASEQGVAHMKGCSLSNTLVVKGMGRTGLVSVSQLVRKGARVIFEGDSATVEKGGQRVAVFTQRPNGLWALPMSTPAIAAAAATRADMARFWHSALAHPGVDTLELMAKVQAVEGWGMHPGDFEDLRLQLCESCIMGKMARLPFPPSTSTYQPLELLHSYVVGPCSGIGSPLLGDAD